MILKHNSLHMGYLKLSTPTVKIAASPSLDFRDGSPTTAVVLAQCQGKPWAMVVALKAKSKAKAKAKTPKLHPANSSWHDVLLAQKSQSSLALRRRKQRQRLSFTPNALG
jgi:hypothetical protein